jgi:hypothetical protein
MTAAPSTPPAFSTSSFDGPAECSANPACVGLADNCCPTIDNVLLYCCFEDGTPGVEYGTEFTLVTPQSPTDQATYIISTAPYFDPGTAPDGTAPVISYVRDAMEVYDLVYYSTASITDAGPFLTGDKKFYIDIYTEAPACTQIYLQLDSLSLAAPDNYPSGRHSRYVTFTTKTGEWERLEFDFLDRPDPTVTNDVIDAIALFFDPGTNNDDAYFYKNLDVSAKGCTSDCDVPSPKSCSAFLSGEICDDGIDNDNDGWVDCEDSECIDHPACVGQMTRSYRSASNLLRADGFSAAASNVRQFASTVGLLLSLFCTSLVLLSFEA